MEHLPDMLWDTGMKYLPVMPWDTGMKHLPNILQDMGVRARDEGCRPGQWDSGQILKTQLPSPPTMKKISH